MSNLTWRFEFHFRFPVFSRCRFPFQSPIPPSGSPTALPTTFATGPAIRPAFSRSSQPRRVYGRAASSPTWAPARASRPNCSCRTATRVCCRAERRHASRGRSRCWPTTHGSTAWWARPRPPASPTAASTTWSQRRPFTGSTPKRTRREFARILPPPGWVVLLWNTRRVDTTPFLRAYESLAAAVRYRLSAGRPPQYRPGKAQAFYARPVPAAQCWQNEQIFDLAGLRGRLCSSSYTPPPGDPRYEPMIAACWNRIFQDNQQDGHVRFDTTPNFTSATSVEECVGEQRSSRPRLFVLLRFVTSERWRRSILLETGAFDPQQQGACVLGPEGIAIGFRGAPSFILAVDLSDRVE